MAKLNRQNRIVPYLLVLSERALYIVDRDTFRLCRRVPLKIIESLHLSDMADHFLAVMVGGCWGRCHWEEGRKDGGAGERGSWGGRAGEGEGGKIGRG